MRRRTEIPHVATELVPRRREGGQFCKHGLSEAQTWSAVLALGSALCTQSRVAHVPPFDLPLDIHFERRFGDGDGLQPAKMWGRRRANISGPIVERDIGGGDRARLRWGRQGSLSANFEGPNEGRAEPRDHYISIAGDARPGRRPYRTYGLYFNQTSTDLALSSRL